MLLLASLLAAVFFCLRVDVVTAAAGQEYMAEAVWIKPADRGNSIVYSALLNDAWSSSVRLSEEGRTNLVPTIAGTGNNRTFVVWSVMTRVGSYLNYVILQDGIIIQGPEKIETGLSSNLAASLAIDNDGAPWLVWAGNNGTPSDIYYSYWQDNHWLPPKKAHAENSVPDILPRLEADLTGNIIATWDTVGPEGHMTVTRVLSSAKAEGALGSVSPAATEPGKGAGNLLDCVPTLPMDETVRDKAVLLSRCQKDSLPVQVRFGRKGDRQGAFPTDTP